MMRTFSAALLCAILGMPGMAAQDEQEPFIPITDEMLLNPDPKDWLMHYRTFDFSGYSPLDQINGSNVDRLQLAWMRAMDAGGQEIRPLVYEGIMYVAHAGSDHIQAWDATTGDLIWDYKRELPGNILDYRTAGARTRNLAMYDDKVYHLTRDTYLIALHARTGALVWETQISDLEDGIAHSSGPVVVKGKVLAGRTCSMRSGLRCFISAHDALTGKELWRTHTTPAQGEPGSASWGDLPTEQRVHVSPWGTPGSYDPELDLVYWGVAVPGPYPRIIRRGKWDVGDKTPCELYSNSTLALDPDTGEIKWYYQHLPCDEWDADFVQERTLIDTVVDPDPESCPDSLAWSMLSYARMYPAGFWERVYPKIMPKQDSGDKSEAFTDDGRDLVKIEEALRSAQSPLGSDEKA
ncbi:MAG: PQQ-binding-like beta-propeller repeat protein [Acidobacteria bacterium]|nr:PQQ-binding-like beta-propeller repeat protein [Acidobacteriota bacterium]